MNQKSTTKQPHVSVWNKFLPYLLALVAFVMFANTIGNGYNMDDELVTKKHKYTSKGFAGLKDIFTKPYYSDDMGYQYGYRPMVHASYAVEHQFFGENVHVSHFFNVVLYAVLVLVFFRLLMLLSGENKMFSIVATLLFALHPVHTEVVASIKNRDEILALLFGLMAGLAFFRAFSQKKVWKLGLAFLWFGMALLSKKSMYPLAVIFPLGCVLLYKYPLKQVLLYTAALVIPGALIVSEFDTSRMLLLFAFPFVIVFVAYKTLELLDGKMKGFSEKALRVLKHDALLSILVWLMTVYGLWTLNWGLVLVAFVGLVLLTVKNWKTGMPQLAVWVTVFAQFTMVAQAWRVAIFLPLAMLTFQYRGFDKRLRAVWIAVAVGVLALFFYGHHEGDDFFSVLTFLGLCVVIFFNKKISLGVWVIVFTTATIFNSRFSEYEALLGLLGVFTLASLKFKGADMGRWVSYAALACGLAFFAVSGTQLPGNNSAPIQTVRPSARQAGPGVQQPKSFMQEGRTLEYAENALVDNPTRAEKIGTGAVTLGEYLRLMVFPYQLSFYYGYAELDLTDMNNPWVWAILAVHLALLGLAVWQVRKRPLLSLGIFWYLFSIGLFSNWVELVAGMVGERLAFTASAGFCIFIAAGLMWIKPQFSLKSAGIVEGLVGLVLVAFCLRTVTRNADWKNQLTLMGNDITHLENSAQANNLYALNLMQNSFENKKLKPEQQYNMRKLAIKHFDRAVQIWPNFFNAAYDKGRAADIIGDLPTAIKGFEQAVAMGHTDFMDPNYQLGELYLRAGRYPDFLNNARRTFAMNPSAESYSMLARGFFITGRADSAKFYLRRGIAAYPDQVNLKRNIIEVFKAEGQIDSVNYYSGK